MTYGTQRLYWFAFTHFISSAISIFYHNIKIKSFVKLKFNFFLYIRINCPTVSISLISVLVSKARQKKPGPGSTRHGGTPVVPIHGLHCQLHSCECGLLVIRFLSPVSLLILLAWLHAQQRFLLPNHRATKHDLLLLPLLLPDFLPSSHLLLL